MPPDLRPHLQICGISSALVGMALITGGVAMGSMVMFVTGIAIPVAWQIADLNMTDHGRFGRMVTRFVAWATKGEAVVVMDFTHDEKVIVVWPRDDGAWHGWLRWTMASGSITLLPNGLVDPTCECRFVYIWKPLNRGLAVELILKSDQWPDWSDWQRMSHMEMMLAREKLTS